jgi:hypothetical protein
MGGSAGTGGLDHGTSPIYTWSVATPVGPAPRNPNDPDFWDWGDDHDDVGPRRRPLRLVVIGIIALALVLLLVVNLL